jgi:hypothetical protein
LEPQHQINVLTADQSFVRRLYYIDASDIARLREAASRDAGQRATRVQAVSVGKVLMVFRDRLGRYLVGLNVRRGTMLRGLGLAHLTRGLVR